MTRTGLRLDDDAWKELSDALNATRQEAFEIGQESEARLRKRGETGSRAMLMLLAFEPSREAPKPPAARRPKRRRQRTVSRA